MKALDFGGRIFRYAGCLLACVCGASLGHAQIITLADKNSVAQVNLGSQAGMFNWTADGQNQLVQQWFWYRVGNNPEASINTIGGLTFSTPDARSLNSTYDNGSYAVTISYLLTGFSPGSGVSDIAETISILNRTGAPLEFHFFQYSDFDLGGAGNDTIQLGKNLRGQYNEASQSDPAVALTETVVTPGANHGEAAFFNTTLAKLNNGVADNLNDNVGPVGPGDVTWALQWDFSIAPGSSVGISKDKYLHILAIPEPSALALLAVGGAALILRRRRV